MASKGFLDIARDVLNTKDGQEFLNTLASKTKSGASIANSIRTPQRRTLLPGRAQSQKRTASTPEATSEAPAKPPRKR